MIDKYIKNGVEVPLDKLQGEPEVPYSPTTPKMQGYRTFVIFAVILSAVVTSPEIQQIVSEYPKSFGTFMTVVAVICRVITTTRLFNKE